ncbi:MAG TPA: nitrilase-related carbon-nitrogen hydrolase [Tepidiformaceae bacterium]|nr:nitrilase-related carbon-nitrogen hydrolase [Tepidiformaceae bacterium]
MTPFTVALCQVRAYDIEEAETNLQGILAALDEAGRRGAQLVGLPECAYPAYYIKDANPYDRPDVRPFDEVCGLLAAKARQYGYWLAAGMAVPHGPGRVTNSAVVFGPDGEVKGRYDKSFLWHFDTYWFERGREWPVWDTGFCRFGVLICADGRQPEVARSLAVNGAEVILDLTAWVSWARTTAELTTTQCEYLMPVRALENGVWVAAADKWGPEDQSIIYAGRSTVIGPDGVTRVCAPSDQETVVVFGIEPEAAEAVPRRPALYRRLVEPTDSLPVTKLLDETLVPDRGNRRVAIVPGNGAFDVEAMLAHYEGLRRQESDLVVFAGSHGPEGWQVDLPRIEATVREHGGALAFAVSTNGCAQAQSALLVTAERTHEHQATHGRGIALGESPAPVVATPAGNVGLLCGDEGLVPEVGRCLALEGAEILAWPLFAAHPQAERVARCRSDENRVYTAAAWPGGGVITAPNGSPLTAVPEGTGVAMAAQVNRALARWKDMAPHTHAIRDRLPEAYGHLVR